MYETAAKEEEPKQKEWTIMVYLAGDNDLSETMARRVMDLRRLADADLSRINLLVYYDGNNPTIKSRYENVTALKVRPDLSSAAPEPTKLVSEQNTASPWTLKRFVEWCVKKDSQHAIADNYALLIAGHGDGFQGSSFLGDTSPSGHMTIRQLKTALKEIQTELFDGNLLNLLIFDSCVMNTFEVAYEFREHVETIVGSQGFMYQSGVSYSRIVDGLIELDQNKTKTTKDQLSRLIVSSTVDENVGYVELNGRSVDMSVFDLSSDKIAAAYESIHYLGSSLSAALRFETNQPDPLVPPREMLLKAVLSAHWHCQTYLWDQSIDIIDFARHLERECFQINDHLERILRLSGVVSEDEKGNFSVAFFDSTPMEDRLAVSSVAAYLTRVRAVGKACGHVVKTVGECIETSYFSGPDFQFSNGISLLFPWTFYTLEIVGNVYKKFEFAWQNEKMTPWYEFLDLYLDMTMRTETESFSPVSRDAEFKWLPYTFTTSRKPKGTLIDPPVMLNEAYKDYFGRIKNFDWNTKGGSSKP